MFKKFLAAVITVSVLLSFAVVPAHAETFYNTGTFSEANWAQYERGFYTSTSDFNKYFEEYTNTSYGDEQLTAVRMVGASTKTLGSNRNPVAYKFGEDAASYGVHADDKAVYAHMSFYLATFSDQWRNCFDYFQLRIDKDGTGASRDTYIFDTYKPGGGDEYASSVYPTLYSNKEAYVTKDWFGILKQGKLGNGPSDTADSNTREISDSDYNKIDIIVEYNKQSGATSYVFADGKLMGCYYDSGLTDKHFHGIVFRVLKDKKIRGNSDYIAVKFDDDRIGHREYYNTDDYMVTLEDVMQDAGLGIDTGDSKIMFKTDEIQNYMPGNDQTAYIFKSDDSERKRINENVEYAGNTATITVTNEDTENYAVAANMLAGVYAQNRKFGVSYESYHPRARFIKLSFDQTISESGMWLEYATLYSGQKRAMQMWDNGGYLVVGIKGGKNETLNGSGGKALAEITGKNHIDWIIEPDEEGERTKQYVYVNGTFVGSGSIDDKYTVRVADIVLSTMKAAGTVTIENWTMTVYNGNMTLDDFNYYYAYKSGYKAFVSDLKVNKGEDEKFTISGLARNTDGDDVPKENTKIYTVLFDEYNNLLDFKVNNYASDEVFENSFNATYTDGTPNKARVIVWHPSTRAPYAQIKELSISLE